MMPGKLLKLDLEKEILQLKREVEEMKITPTLEIIRVGCDPASKKYVDNKRKMGNKVGIKTSVTVFKEDTTEEQLILYIDQINKNKDIHGCLIQLPLPKHIDENKVLETLDYKKDVDGFAKENLGKLLRGEEGILPCTPKGIIELLKFYDIPIKGKNVTIINRSTIVGKPLSLLFLQEDATITVCHSKTNKYRMHNYIYSSDIVVTAMGIPNYFRFFHFNPKTTIIDVSINSDENGKMCGDVCKEDYEFLLQKGCNITPVPGGIGPCTVLNLIKNTIQVAKNQK